MVLSDGNDAWMRELWRRFAANSSEGKQKMNAISLGVWGKKETNIKTVSFCETF